MLAGVALPPLGKSSLNEFVLILCRSDGCRSYVAGLADLTSLVPVANSSAEQHLTGHFVTVRNLKHIAPPAQRAFARSKGIFLSVGVFSGFVNVLALAGSFYMLQIYDRILPSESVPTLVALTGLLIGLYLVYGMLDLVRVRLMGRVGARFDHDVREPVFNALHTLPLRQQSSVDAAQPLRDLDQVRSFLSSLGPTAFFDLPWVPIYLFAVYLLHPVLGMTAAAGAALLVLIAILTEVRSAKPTQAAAQSGMDRSALSEAMRRNAEVIQAMGLARHLRQRWGDVSDRFVGEQMAASDTVTGFGTLSKVLRLLLQSGILGLGAYLVILDQVTPGVIIAASIITSRALAPVETSISHWRGFVAARQAYRRLNEVLAGALSGADGEPIDLPAPRSTLSVQALAIAPPGVKVPVIRNVSFDLKAGDGLGIIGPSAAGKSTLVRALVGIWKPMALGGAVRLDGAALQQWTPEKLGRHIGYLPQDVELFAGTIADNISRFDPEQNDEDIVRAAKVAGVHDMVVQLSDGYLTEVGESGRQLSAGQRQRVALARALYKDPFLVVLDEPNSNLDAVGEAALAGAIQSVRKRGGIAIIVAHRPSALATVDQVLAMANGQVADFGPKDDVLRKFVRAAGKPGPQKPPAGPVPKRTSAAGTSAPSSLPGLTIVPDNGGDK